MIEDVVLVDGLKHNLLSIGQLCDKGLRVIFDDSTCDVLNKKIDSCALFSFCENSVYMIDTLNLNAMPLIWMLLMKSLGYGIRDLDIYRLTTYPELIIRNQWKAFLIWNLKSTAIVMRTNLRNKSSSLSKQSMKSWYQDL